MLTAAVSISDFARELRAVSEKDFTIPNVQRFLREHHVAPDTLAPYLLFDPQHYTRNLIDKTDLYELIAICWDSGQASSIHNHHEQNCWMAAPIGRLEVQNYRVVEQDAARGFCRLEPTNKLIISADDPVSVDPEEPVHKVSNLAEYGNRAVSLHIYSRPFDRCLVYSPEQQKYGEITLSYTTVYGKKVNSQQ